jgi:hypothetical protein
MSGLSEKNRGKFDTGWEQWSLVISAVCVGHVGEEIRRLSV